MPTPTAAVALLRTEAAQKKESEKNRKASGQMSFRNDVLSRFSSGGDALNSREVVKWLSGLSPDGVITDDELRWILMLGNTHSSSSKRYQGCMKDMDINKAMIYPDTFESVIQTWAMYTKNKASIVRIFQEFDVDQNGSLSRSETSNFLKTLNNGIAPSEEDMEWVFQTWDMIGQGEGIETPEILYLINAWDKRPSRQIKNGEPSAPEGSSGTTVAVPPSPVCGHCLLQ
jgi:Ca2+-binding EF-hand superfamily protein